MAGALFVGFMVAPATSATADTAPPAGTKATLTADTQPTWQTNGTVWSLASAGSTIFAGGRFSQIRPPGAAPGDTRQQARVNLAGFNSSTGNPTTFSHQITGTPYTSSTNPGPECSSVGTNQWLCDAVMRVKASPDGAKVYAGGDFTAVDGQARGKFAAFDASTGALDPNLKPVVNGRVRAIAVSPTTVYIGGDFTAVNGQARTRLAAFNRSTGALLPWAPTADRGVRALALNADYTRVILGGTFDRVNGADINGVAAVNAVDGQNATWNSRPIPRRTSSTSSEVTDLVVSDGVVYGSAAGHGGGVFDGRFAADANNGNLTWKDTCLGATTALDVLRGVVYSTSHAHNCSSMGGWPETNPATYQRLLAETTESTGNGKPSLLHWYPYLNAGPAGSYYQQGGWAMANDGTNLWVGGEFTVAGNGSQQGLTRFTFHEVAPDINPAQTPWPAPSVSRNLFGGLKISWNATWDQDNRHLRYEIYRDGGGTPPIYTTEKDSTFWNKPSMSYTDTSVARGTAHVYRIKVWDPYNNARTTPNSVSVTA